MKSLEISQKNPSNRQQFLFQGKKRRKETSRTFTHSLMPGQNKKGSQMVRHLTALSFSCLSLSLAGQYWENPATIQPTRLIFIPFLSASFPSSYQILIKVWQGLKGFPLTRPLQTKLQLLPRPHTSRQAEAHPDHNGRRGFPPGLHPIRMNLFSKFEK